jgi:hypothetical protein
VLYLPPRLTSLTGSTRARHHQDSVLESNSPPPPPTAATGVALRPPETTHQRPLPPLTTIASTKYHQSLKSARFSRKKNQKQQIGVKDGHATGNRQKRKLDRHFTSPENKLRRCRSMAAAPPLWTPLNTTATTIFCRRRLRTKRKATPSPA